MNVCPEIEKLNPYKGGKSIDELKRELALDKIVKLASNENPLGSSIKVQEAIKKAAKEVGRYPDGNGFELKYAIGKHLKINTNQITLGNGSNDVLELLARIFICSVHDEVIFSQYAFVLYSLVVQSLGGRAVSVPAKEFGCDLDAMLGSITKQTKLIFIANPNNPTGTLLSDEQVYAFLSKVPSFVVVVLDQAYFEYLDCKDSAIKWLTKFDNLVITRTFSKAYGLAGLRVGYSLSSTKVADYLSRIRQPFNVNHIAQVAAIAALNDDAYLMRSIIANKNGLKQLAQGFDKLQLSYIKSFANFIALKVGNANDVYQKLLRKGLIVRPVEMKGYLRISVGTFNENNDLLDALKLVL